MRMDFENIDHITTQAPFNSLPIKPEMLEKIKANMQAHGFDKSEAIHLWGNICIDGHTRLKAAKELDVKIVPIFRHEFQDETEALAYTIHKQCDRRNITDDQILYWVEVLDVRGQRGGDKKSDKIKAQMHL